MTVISIQDGSEWQPLITRSMREQRALVAKFSAAWCGPCRRMAPVFERLSERYPEAIFVELDIDRVSYVASYVGITSVPTFQVCCTYLQLSLASHSLFLFFSHLFFTPVLFSSG